MSALSDDSLMSNLDGKFKKNNRFPMIGVGGQFGKRIKRGILKIKMTGHSFSWRFIFRVASWRTRFYFESTVLIVLNLNF